MMVRELAVSVYLFIFRLLFYTFRLFPQKEKTTLVASFGDNVLYTVNALERQTEDRIVILKTGQCGLAFQETVRIHVLNFEMKRFVSWLVSIYHLATSHVVFIDNYYGFLAAINFKQNVTCVQLWHAAGAMKQFGLNDPSNKERSLRANARFQTVYNQFDHVVVGSDSMAEIFQESFGLPVERMLWTGVPRTDFYFSEPEMEVVAKRLQKQYPRIADKKVMLYAPTFRDGLLNSTELALDLDAFRKAFSDEYILLLRLHPAILKSFKNNYPDFVIDVSGYANIHDLLVVTDLLITDYSSIPFEFSLLGRPMIFFAYDLEKYRKSRGFSVDYEAFVPGPVVTETEELIQVIKEDKFDLTSVDAFATEWNEYSRGDSSKRLIDTLYSTIQEVSNE